MPDTAALPEAPPDALPDGRVFVVDDDDAVRSAVLELLAAEGLAGHGHAAGAAFFAAERPDVPSCLVCDMNMPGLDGLDIAAELARQGAAMPIIFMTGFGSIPLTVQAMKAGAVEFLTKPVAPATLMQAVRAALAADAAALDARRDGTALRARYATLTPRERETLQLVLGGLLIKQVAQAMGISDIVAKLHKRKVMDKMAARSLPDLVLAAARLGIARTRGR